MMQSAAHPRRKLGTVWTTVLIADTLATLPTAAALALTGLLLPAVVDDYEMSTARHLVEGGGLFGIAALLVGSLVASYVLVGTDRRRLALRMAVARLALLLAGAASVVARGGEIGF